MKHVLQVHLLQHATSFIEKNIFACNKTLRHVHSKIFPLDHITLGYMLGKIDNSKHMTLSQFKTLLIKIWDEIPQQVVGALKEM
jgi:hypothetical protein